MLRICTVYILSYIACPSTLCNCTNILISAYIYNVCMHTYIDLSISAETPDDGSIRLVGGPNAHEGHVEMYLLGHWVSVCFPYWDLVDATVVCRQLGYPAASLYRTMLHKLSLEERISICGYKICVAMVMKVASFSAAMG